MSIVEFLSQPLWQRLGLTLIHFLWQALTLAVLIAVLVRAFKLKHGNARYVAYLVAFAAMIACPIITFTAIDIPLSSNTKFVAEIQPAQITDSSSHAILLPFASDSISQEAVTGSALAYSIPLREKIFDWLHKSMPWIMMIWMVGVTVLSGRLLVGLIGVYRWRHHLEPLPQRLAQRVTSLSKQMGMRRFGRVFISPSVFQAMALGYLQPMVLLPAAMVTQMQPEMLEAIIAHELAHIRRFDLWVNLAQRVTETLLFYHPAVWWLSSCIRSERELCCDELAVKATGERITYATTLESVSRFKLIAKQPALAMGLGQDNKPTLSRVRHILGLTPIQRNCPFWLAGVIAVVFLATLLIPTALALSDDKDNKAIYKKSGSGIPTQIQNSTAKVESGKKINEIHSDKSKLEFRIIPQSPFSSYDARGKTVRLEPEHIKIYRDQLKQNGPTANSDNPFIWLPVKEGAGVRFSGVVENTTYNGKKYVLVCNTKSTAIIADGSWGLDKVYRHQDYQGKTAVMFEFDESGAKSFYQLTKTYRSNILAIIINGEIYSAPRIMSAVRGQGMVSGNFTQQEAEELAVKLQKGMPAVVPKHDGQQSGFDPTIEITVNDAPSVGKDCLIDFDTGKLFSLPENWREVMEKNDGEWVIKNGIDASAATRSNIKGFICEDMIFTIAPGGSSYWDNVKADSLVTSDLWEMGKPGRPAYMTAQGQLPATYIFKTREGRIGILQITGFNDEPRGVNIRYKMVTNYGEKNKNAD